VTGGAHSMTGKSVLHSSHHCLALISVVQLLPTGNRGGSCVMNWAMLKLQTNQMPLLFPQADAALTRCRHLNSCGCKCLAPWVTARAGFPLRCDYFGRRTRRLHGSLPSDYFGGLGKAARGQLVGCQQWRVHAGSRCKGRAGAAQGRGGSHSCLPRLHPRRTRGAERGRGCSSAQRGRGCSSAESGRGFSSRAALFLLG
jgi:hypothetical protein